MSAAAGSWMLLSRVLARVPEDQREAKQRALIERIASGEYRVRYSNADELNTHRDGNQLHADFFRLGRVNWVFSALTFGDDTIHQIEIFYPGAEATPDRVQGRPSSKVLIEAEGERLVASGYRSLKAFAKDVQREVRRHRKPPGTELGTVRNHLRPIWRRRKTV